MSDSTKGKLSKKEERLRGEIAARRREVSHALDVLRLGAHREFAFIPKGEKWLLPTVAFGLGLAFAGRPKPKPAYAPPATGEAVVVDGVVVPPPEPSARHAADPAAFESPLDGEASVPVDPIDPVSGRKV